MNQVDRLLKGMSAEMKNGIREDEAAIAARKSRQEAKRQEAKIQEAVSTDSVVDEKKRKKKVSIVVRAAYSLTSLSYIPHSLTLKNRRYPERTFRRRTIHHRHRHPKQHPRKVLFPSTKSRQKLHHQQSRRQAKVQDENHPHLHPRIE